MVKKNELEDINKLLNERDKLEDVIRKINENGLFVCYKTKVTRSISDRLGLFELDSLSDSYKDAQLEVLNKELNEINLKLKKLGYEDN